jgi:hypothetical protein
MNDICYYCGQIATSDEHSPPKTLFPKLKDSPDGRDYRKNLLTVRSCDTHNTEKSKEDEYLLYVLVMSLPSNEVAKNQYLTKVKRAIDRRPKLLERLLLKTEEVTVHDTVANEWHRTIAIQPEEHRLVSIFTSIAKALYFREKCAVWPGQVSVLIEFMLSLSDLAQNQRQRILEEQLNQVLGDVPHKGENPDVFSYQFVEADGKTFARLHFYGNSRVSVVFIA